MCECMLPQQEAAAAFLNTEYSCPGLFQFSSLVYQYIKMVQDKFDWTVPIHYLYGAPSVKWNGGRVLVQQDEPPISIDHIAEELSNCAAHQIKPLLTFSNYHISDQDLDDPVGNDILAMLLKTEGGVIITSKKLEQHIRANFPRLEIHASVAQTTFLEKRTAEYYSSLSQHYDQYVVHPDDLFNPDLLKQIPTRNAEILVNERCYFNCTLRNQHYASISREQQTKSSGLYRDERFLDQCQAIPEWKQHSSKRRNISLSYSETDHILQNGFHTLKLQGRTNNLFVYFFDLMRYTLENEVAFPCAYPIFSSAIEQFLKER